MEVEAPRVAKACQPGEFVIVRMDERGERIPLTICDYNREEGTICIVFQTVGASTERMAGLKAGDAFADVTGPLGNPSEFVHEDIEKLQSKKMLFIAGGVGTAPVYPQVKWLHEHGIKVDVIIGAKTKDLLILTKEMAAVSDYLYVATDDGSYGFKGLVTQVLEDLVKNQHKQYDHCVVIRAYDHDEICLSDDKKSGYSNDSQSESDYGRWYRDVRRLPCHCWRRSEICLCGRSGI